MSTYPWLGRTTKFREWLGDRVIQALEAHSYTIANRNFEDTVSIDRNDIEDDTYGVYEPIIEQLGWDTKVHPDMLLFQMIKNSVTTPSSVIGYDGQPFFSATHPVGPLGRAGCGFECLQHQQLGLGPVLVPYRCVARDPSFHLPAPARIRRHPDEFRHR